MASRGRKPNPYAFSHWVPDSYVLKIDNELVHDISENAEGLWLLDGKSEPLYASAKEAMKACEPPKAEPGAGSGAEGGRTNE